MRRKQRQFLLLGNMTIKLLKVQMQLAQKKEAQLMLAPYAEIHIQKKPILQTMIIRK